MVPFAWPVLWPSFLCVFVGDCAKSATSTSANRANQFDMLTNVDSTRLLINYKYFACLLCNTPRCWSCASLSPNWHFTLQTVTHWSLDLWRHTRRIDEYTEPKAMFHNAPCPNHTTTIPFYTKRAPCSFQGNQILQELLPSCRDTGTSSAVREIAQRVSRSLLAQRTLAASAWAYHSIPCWTLLNYWAYLKSPTWMMDVVVMLQR